MTQTNRFSQLDRVSRFDAMSRVDLTGVPGHGHHDLLPSSQDAGYADWVERHHHDVAALAGRRDRRRLARAVRHARRLRRRADRAWALARQAELRVREAPSC